jgi:hypothetical protein
MTTITPQAHAADEIRRIAGDDWCEGGLAILDTALDKGPTLTTAVESLYHLNVDARDEVLAVLARLVDQLTVIEKPGRVLHETFRTDLGVYRAYGPAAGADGNLRWGQGTAAKPERAGTYRPEHLRIDHGLHFDLRPDRAGLTNPAGRPTFECGFIATRVPLYVDITVVARWYSSTGFWPCPLWLTAATGGWSTFEIDGPEDFGSPPSEWDHGRHSLATHIGFDSMASPPSINAQANLLKQGHWHQNPTDGQLHAHGLRIEPDHYTPTAYGTTLPHLIITWSLDGHLVQQLRTSQFELLEPPRRLAEAITALQNGWNLYHCTQISKRWNPTRGTTVASAMQIDEVTVDQLAVAGA